MKPSWAARLEIRHLAPDLTQNSDFDISTQLAQAEQ